MSSNVITGTAPNVLSGRVDSFFEISKHGSTFGREVRGGFVTLFAMVYILVLNPIILSHALSKGGSIAMPDIVAETALTAGIMTILMGVVVNHPIALAAKLGLNVVVAFTLVLSSGLNFQEVMGLILWEGVVITVLVLTSFCEVVSRAMPRWMRAVISVGTGPFITFIGLINGEIVRSQSGTVVGLDINGSLTGWPVSIFVFRLLLTAVPYAARTRGSILVGIMSPTVLAVIVQLFAKPEMKSNKVPTGWG